MEESSLYNHGINHELTNFCTLNHDIIKQVQKFKIICMDTNSMNLISTLCVVREWEVKESIGWVMWCGCGWVRVRRLCKSRLVGGTPVSLSWFLKISSLARLSSEFWVYDLLVDTGVFAVQTVCRAEPRLSDFTFQHIPATVDSRKVHGCDLGMMAPQGLRMIRYYIVTVSF